MKALKIDFYPENILILLFAKFDILQGVFYKLLSGNIELLNRVHNAKPDNGKQLKMFCFSELHGNYRIYEKSIAYSENISWEIRSMKDEIIDEISKSLIANGQFRIGDVKYTVSNLQEQNNLTLYSTAISIITDTPITVYETSQDGFRTFYSPEDEQFFTAVENNLRNKYMFLYGDSNPGRVIFTKNPGAKIRKCVTYYSGAPVTAYYGKFVLTASKEICDIAYYCGLGAKNSQGFGTIK